MTLIQADNQRHGYAMRTIDPAGHTISFNGKGLASYRREACVWEQ